MFNRRQNVVPCLVAAGLLVISTGLLSSCASHQVTRVDSPEYLDTMDIDIQDWENAASELSESLLAAGIFGQGGEPSRIVISRFINDTSRRVDRDRLLRRVRVAMNRAGVAQTDMIRGLGGQSEDPYASEHASVQQFINRQSTPAPQPDFSITVKLMEDRARVGRTRQIAYFFEMAVTDLKTGAAVWEDQVSVVKQGRGSSVGW